MNAVAQKDNVVEFPKIKFGLDPAQELKILDMSERMCSALKSDRNEYENDHEELANYFAPHLYRKENDQTKTRKSKWNKIINNTARRAVRTMAAGMQSGLTSPSRPWLKVGIEDFDLQEFGPVKEYFRETTSRMLTMFRRTKMYNTSHMIYTNMGIFGTAAQLMMQDFEELILFRALMQGRVWIGVNSKGNVDQAVIQRSMTVMQMVEEFGIDNVDPTTKNQYNKGDYYIRKIVWMAIFGNPFAKKETDFDGNFQMVAANQKLYVSCHWTEGFKRPLKTSGFDRFPVQAPRWETTDDEAYGFGPGHDAIGDNKAMQMKEREKGKGIKKMVTPPVSAPSEMRGGLFPISGLPGGVTYRPSSTQPDAIRTMYEINLPLQYLFQDIAIDEDRVNKAFYADLFLMLANSDRRQMTATEVAERHEEKLLALGPVIERLAYEYLDPMVERSFEIMFQNGLLPPPPPEIQGMPLKVEYVSLLAQAQQQVGIGSIESFLSFTGFAAQYFPEVVDKVNYDQAVDEVGGMLGVPENIINSDEAVAQQRGQRAEQQAQQQRIELGMAGVSAAKELSETPIGDSTALETLTGV